MNLEQAVCGIEEGEAGVVVMDDALERGDDAAEEFVGLEAGDEDVVDFEQDAEAIAFARELRLISLRRFEIERVVYGDGDLAGNALHKGELAVGLCETARNQAAETHGPKAALRGGERNERETANAFVAEALHEFGVALFFGGVADHESFLSAPDFAGRVAVHGSFGADVFVVGDARLENVKAHDVADGIVKSERQEIEIDDGVEALGEIVEEDGEVALLGDGFADFEEGFELAAGVFVGLGDGGGGEWRCWNGGACVRGGCTGRGGHRFGRSDDRVRHITRIASGSAVAQPGCYVVSGVSVFVERVRRSATFLDWIAIES